VVGRILMLESSKGLSKQAIDHLAKEFISVDVTDDLVEFLRLRVRGTYDLVLISLDHADPGARVVPELMLGRFNTPLMYFSDRRRPEAKEILMRLGIDTALSSPPSGASIEKFLKTRILGPKKDSFASADVQRHLAHHLAKGIEASAFREIAIEILGSMPAATSESIPKIVLVDQDLGSLVLGKESIHFGFRSHSHSGQGRIAREAAGGVGVPKALDVLFKAFFSLAERDTRELSESGIELVARPRPLTDAKDAFSLERNMYFVLLDQVVVGSTLDFDVYLRLTKAEKFLKYVGQGSVFTQEHAEKVGGHGFRGLYLSQDHVSRFYASQLGHLPR
jgi:hypothetical protein